MTVPASTSSVNGVETLSFGDPEVQRRSRSWWLTLTMLVIVLVIVLGSAPIGPAKPWLTVILLVIHAALALTLWRQGRADRDRYEAEITRRSADTAVATERLAIARDLHDIVSHGLGSITVRASVALRLWGKAQQGDTDHTKGTNHGNDLVSALTDVESAARSATAELRRMVGLLRYDDTVALLQPPPGLHAVDRLADQSRANGIDVQLDLPDPLPALSPGLDITIYRVIQESLTNVARHVGPTTVSISYLRSDNHCRLEIDDCGPRTRWEPKPGAGWGLRGLAERVSLMGGTLIPERRDNGGFRVLAILPVDDETDLLTPPNTPEGEPIENQTKDSR